MTDLAAFLRARLDEDERTARAATIGPWRVVNVTSYGSATIDGPDALQDGGYDETTKTRTQKMRPLTVIPQDVDYGPTVDLVDAEHIVRHDPARVLAEVEAKRRIIEEAEAVIDEDRFGEWGHGGQTLRLLALPYAHHPDYDESWRP